MGFPAEAVAGGLLAYATYTDLRWRLIRNWAVIVAAAAGLTLGYGAHGLPGLPICLVGMAVALIWWPVVAFFRLGAGDAKLAMALGALLGPMPALAAPALGFILCAAGLLPWIIWRHMRRQPWRHLSLPMAPWIAAGTALAVILRAVGAL